MIKVITWFKRKSGTEVEEFRRYWRNEHPKAVLQLPGLRKYVQNHVTDANYKRGEPLADGVAETWWDDRDALAAHRDTPPLADLLADEARFMDLDRRDQLLAEEVVINPVAIPPGGGLKQIVFIKRRADLSIADALAHWRDVHGPLAIANPTLGRYVQNHALAHQYREGRPEPTFDGATMAWFDDLDAARAAATAEEAKAVVADQPLFLNDDPMALLTVDEHHII